MDFTDSESRTSLLRRHSISAANESKPISESFNGISVDEIPRLHYTKNKELLQLGLYILGWYVFSVAISLYNKWMFGQSKLNFPFPILITSGHQLLLSIASYLIIRFTSLRDHKDDQLFSWSQYAKTVLPCAAGSAGDIGFGNMSFRFINLSTYTMVKSSSIAFVLLFSILFKIERFTYNLFGIVILMTVGVMLMSDRDHSVPKENKYFLLGFILVLLSACMSGLRWVLTQILLRQNEKIEEVHQTPRKQEADEHNSHKRHPLFTINQLSPPVFGILLVVGLMVEGGINFIKAEIWGQKGVPLGIALLLFPGILVLFMTIFEFGILQRSRVLTLSIAGIFKELLTILVSFLVFDDTLTWVNFIGLLVTLVDIVWYNVYRYRQNKIEEEIKQEEAIELAQRR